MSAVGNDAALHRAGQVLKLLERTDAHRVLAAYGPYWHGQLLRRKVQDGWQLSGDAPVDAHRTPDTPGGCKVTGILGEVFIIERTKIKLVGSNKFSEVVTFAACDQKFRNLGCA